MIVQNVSAPSLAGIRAAGIAVSPVLLSRCPVSRRLTPAGESRSPSISSQFETA